MLSLLVAAALAASTPDVTPTNPNLTGEWAIEDVLPRFGVTFPLRCKLTQLGASLHGDCVDQQGVQMAITGTLSNGTVTIGYPANFAGVDCHFVYVGALQPDGGLRGTLSIGELAGTFTASRR